MKRYPTSMRVVCKATLKSPAPEDYILSTWESFEISVNEKEYNMDFEDVALGYTDKTRTAIEVEWKNPDMECFAPVYRALTLDRLKNADIRLCGDLDSTICCMSPDEKGYIELDSIEEMYITSPYNEFEDVNLLK